jgi:hypothetical protein
MTQLQYPTVLVEGIYNQGNLIGGHTLERALQICEATEWEHSPVEMAVNDRRLLVDVHEATLKNYNVLAHGSRPGRLVSQHSRYQLGNGQGFVLENNRFLYLVVGEDEKLGNINFERMGIYYGQLDSGEKIIF